MIELCFHVLPSARRLTRTLRPGELLRLGREDGDLRFPEDGQMSSLHLSISLSGHSVVFQDEGSTNGTFLNGERVMSGTIGPDDLLAISQTHITLVPVRVAKAAPVLPSPSAKLTGNRTALRIEGSEATERHILPGQELTVGRTEKSQWIFPNDDLMSGLHFVLSDSDGRWDVRDAGSLNGTLLNQEPIDRAVLSHGDTLSAGHSRFKVWIEQIDSDIEPPSSQSASEAQPNTIDDLHTTSPTSVVSETRESLEVQDGTFSHFWLAELSGKGISLCLKKGSDIHILPGTASTAKGKLRVNWAGPTCLVSTEGAPAGEFLLNDQLTSGSEVANGDLITWLNFRFQVLFTESPSTSPFPEVATSNLNAEPPTSLTMKSAPSKQDAEPAVQSELVLAEIVDGNVVTASPPSDSKPAAKPVAKAEAVHTDSVSPANHASHIFKSPLPGDDPIELMLGIAATGKCWLISVDPKHPHQLSVPTEISNQDPSWMLQVQNGWPANLFLIVFAEATAEEVLIALLNASAKPTSYTAASCLKWLQAESSLWNSTPIQSALVLDSPSRSWCVISGAPLPAALKNAVARHKG